MSKTKINWRVLIAEFLSIFVAVTLAFALERWNENRRESRSEEKILQEIKNGLQLDLVDLKQNKEGHLLGLRACSYFDERIEKSGLPTDSSYIYYGALTSYFLSKTVRVTNRCNPWACKRFLMIRSA